MDTIIEIDYEVKMFTKELFDEHGEIFASCYARIFDCKDSPWKDTDAEYNLFNLRLTEAYANDLLKYNGYVYLNDVYEMLGLSKVEKFEYVGWRYDENNEVGDSYVSFGIVESYNRGFINGESMKLLLDFNVDGYIGKRNK